MLESTRWPREPKLPAWALPLADLGVRPPDPPELRAQKRLQTLMAWASLPMVGSWGGLFGLLGRWDLSLYPFSYCVVTLGMLALLPWTQGFQWFRVGHPALVMAAPYALHWALGGIQGSAGAILWSGIGLVAALLFLGPDRSLLWFWVLLIGIALTGLRIGPLRPESFELTRWQIDFMFLFTVTGFFSFIYLSGRFFYALQAFERGRSEFLLGNILPESISARLRQDQGVLADSHPEVTVLFSDLVGFTPLSRTKTAPELVSILDRIFSDFDGLCEAHGLEKIKTIGDAYMCAAGLPEACEDHAERAAALALDMVACLERVSKQLEVDLQLRIGLHSGEVVAGVIGQKKFAYDIWGDTVNTASRMESHSLPGRIQVSRATRERLGDRFRVESRGTLEVKGLGLQETFFLLSEDDSLADRG